MQKLESQLPPRKNPQRSVLRAWKRCLDTALKLGQTARIKPLAMTCEPPHPEKAFAIGDLDPLGFLLRALKNAPPEPDRDTTVKGLEDLLRQKRQGRLWGFDADHMITSIDSSLILLGIEEPDSVEALEIFYDGKNGYYPQLWSGKPQPDHMLISDVYRHWCQVDYATTCIVRWLRMMAGLSTQTSINYLVSGFEQRSGLFFANPYLVDWALSLAIAGEPKAKNLRKRLLKEILASQGSDHSFGSFDIPLSTAFAVLALAEIGYQGEVLHQAQQWLADYWAKRPDLVGARPFYSTGLLDFQGMPARLVFTLLLQNQEHIVKVAGQYHGISYYRDTHDVISTAALALALGVEFGSNYPETKEYNGDFNQQVCHPRYRCNSHAEYIKRSALPPYLKDQKPIEQQHTVEK